MTKIAPLRIALPMTGFVLLAVLAGCASPPRPITPAPPPPPVAPPPPPPQATEWSDLPLSPGGWTYAADPAGSSAGFGIRADAPTLTIRCEKAARLIHVTLAGARAGPVKIVTSYGARDLALIASAGGAKASLPANDSFLDRMAFSRGRVSYAATGLPLLVTPAWAEPARVIEDCRG